MSSSPKKWAQRLLIENLILIAGAEDAEGECVGSRVVPGTRVRE